MLIDVLDERRSIILFWRNLLSVIDVFRFFHHMLLLMGCTHLLLRLVIHRCM